MIANFFHFIMNSHLFAMFTWNFTCLLLRYCFYKKMVENWRLHHCQLTHAYIANSSHSSRTTLLSTVSVKLLRCWDVKRRISSRLRIVRTSIQSTMGSVAGYWLLLKNSWRQPNDGATDRGVMRLGSQHHLCGSESVAYSSVSLRACWRRALWTSDVTAAATVTDILSFELISTMFTVLETYVFSVSSKDKKI